MKIDERKLPLDPLAGGTARVREQALGRLHADRVEVSSAARALAGLRAEVGEIDKIRLERVTALRAALAKGSYAPHLPEVARKVFRELLAELVV